MASEIKREAVLGNFKPSRHEQRQAKASNTPSAKRAELEDNDESHLRAIRKCPCAIPGCNKVGGVDPHHLKCIPGTRGMALRAPDRYAIPLCRFPHHEDAERAGPRNERKYFADNGLDCEALADALWHAPRGDAAAYTRIVLAHKGVTRKP